MDDASKRDVRGLSPVACLAVAVATLAVGFLLGRFALGNTNASQTSGSSATQATSSKTGLDDKNNEDPARQAGVVATYTYQGITHQLSATEVLEQRASLQADGSPQSGRETPSADDVLSCVRAQILLQAADEAGVKVSADQVATYAKDVFGTDDYAAIAQANNTSTQIAKRIVEDAARIEALRNKVLQEESKSASRDTGDAWQSYANALFDEASVTIYTLSEG